MNRDAPVADAVEPVAPSRARRLGAVGRPGALLLGLASLCVTVHVWLASGVLVPIVLRTGTEYVFVSASGGAFVAIAFVAAIAVFGGHLALRAVAARFSPPLPLFSREDVGYARPLLWFGISTLGLLTLVPAVSHIPPVWSYVVTDTRWWWTALLLAWVWWRVDERLNGALRARVARVRLPGMVRKWGPETVLAALAVTWVVAGTPQLRFGEGTVGDEPKYLRYCENFYQGNGFNVDRIQPMAQLPENFRPPLWQNVTLLVETVPDVLRSLAADMVAVVGDPSRRFNRARVADAGFVFGKNGGVYQIYNPGVSLLMFPAYYVDRRFATVQPGSPAQWPARLPAVNAFCLAVYAAWAVVIFRFLRRCAPSTVVAWVATAALVLTLPVAAFPFQYYPELAAGLFVSVVAAHVLFPGGRARSVSFLVGLLAGYLPWFHVRFTAVAAVFTLAAVVQWRRDAKRLLAFLGGAAVTGGALMLYVYHVTGSVLPNALWMVEGTRAVFSLPGAARGSVAYLLDRDWGLFAHSPVYLFALAGFWPMARRRPAAAWLSVSVLIALLVPAAGHTLVAAGTTPMRLILAVLPFAATPLVEILGRGDRRRVVHVAFALALILSLHNALAYNLHHSRHVGALVDWSFSGWKVNLLFPAMARAPWLPSIANGVLMIGWLAACLAFLVVPALVAWKHAAPFRRYAGLRASSVPRLGLAAALSLVVIGTAVAAATGVWAHYRYQIPPDKAALGAARLLDQIAECTICVSSERGRVGADALLAHLENVVPSLRDRPGADARVRARELAVMRRQVHAWYVAANGAEPRNEDVDRYIRRWQAGQGAAEIQRQILADAVGRRRPGATD